MITFQYLAAECGAGKTTAVLNKMAKDGGRYVYAAPTIETLGQIRNDFEAKAPGFRCFTIDSAASPLSVHNQQSAVRDEIAFKYPDEPVVVFVSHVAIAICDWPAFKGFRLIVDELMDQIPVHIWTERFEEHTDVLHRYLKLDNEIVKPTAAGKHLLDKGNYDVVQNTVMDLLTLSTRPHAKLYAATSTWANYEQKKQFVRVIDPALLSDFASVLIIGDDFCNSLLFKIWTKDGVNFEPANIELRQRKVPLSERVTIRYFNEHNGSIFYFGNTDDPLGQVGEKLRPFAVDLWTCNKRFESKMYRYLPADRRASSKSHGQNHLTDRHSVAWLCALKFSNDDAAIYKKLYGICKSELVAWREYNAMYQFIMRSNLRAYDSAEPVNVYVFDRQQAEYLASRFNVPFEDLIFDPITNQPKQKKKVAMTNAERVRKHRAMIKLKIESETSFGVGK